MLLSYVIVSASQSQGTGGKSAPILTEKIETAQSEEPRVKLMPAETFMKNYENLDEKMPRSLVAWALGKPDYDIEETLLYKSGDNIATYKYNPKNQSMTVFCIFKNDYIDHKSYHP